MSCGNTTVEKSLTDCTKPMIWYGVPRDDARQARAAVDLVDHHLEVDACCRCRDRSTAAGDTARTASGLVQRPPCASSVRWQRSHVALGDDLARDRSRRRRAAPRTCRARSPGRADRAHRERADGLGQRRVEPGQRRRDRVACTCPCVTSTDVNVPLDSASAASRCAAIGAGLTDASCTRCTAPASHRSRPRAATSTKLTATDAVGERARCDRAPTPLPSVSVKLTVALVAANDTAVTSTATPGEVSHGDGSDAPASPVGPTGPGGPSEPGSPDSPCGPAGPAHATSTSDMERQRMTPTYSQPVPATWVGILRECANVAEQCRDDRTVCAIRPSASVGDLRRSSARRPGGPGSDAEIATRSHEHGVSNSASARHASTAVKIPSTVPSDATTAEPYL